MTLRLEPIESRVRDPGNSVRRIDVLALLAEVRRLRVEVSRAAASARREALREAEEAVAEYSFVDARPHNAVRAIPRWDGTTPIEE